MSSSRVMATCGILGQALGTAVAQSFLENTDIRCVDIKKLQNTLMQDDCFIPWHQREVSSLSQGADCNYDIVRNGKERGDENCLKINQGDFVEYKFNKNTKISEIRIVFDSNLNRPEKNMPCCYRLNEPDYKIPSTLIKCYEIVGENEKGDVFKIEADNNHSRFVLHKTDWNIVSVRLVPKETYGDKNFRIFGFEVS